MKKIVLAAVNARFSHTNISIRYLRNFICDLDYDVILAEFTINQPPSEIAAAIINERPHAVAISVYIWNALIVAEALPLIREALPECVLVLGGPEVSYSHDRWLGAHPEIDHIVRGPGEAGFRKLAGNGMRAETPVIEVPNPHFDAIPFPYTAADFPGLANRTVYYESSRGCPFRCSYCLSSRADQALEFRDAARVREEIAFIMQRGPAYVKFVDRTFNADRARARALWAHIIESYGASKTFFHFEVDPGLLVDEDFSVLEGSPAGLFQLELGIQSTNRDVLREVNRPGDFEAARGKIERLVRMKNIHVHVDQIAGLPGEDEVSLRSSFDRIYALGAGHFQPGILKILHGTGMKEIADAEGYGYSPQPPYQVRSTPLIPARAMEEFESVAYLVERLYNGGAFPIALEKLAAAFGGPYDFYRDMAGFYRGLDGPPLDRSRESCAGFLARYAQSKTDADIQYLLDCIRWDWCRGSGNRHYPAALRSASTLGGAKKFMGMVHAFMREGGPALPPLSEKEVKRAIVFFPESKKFRAEFLSGRGFAVFVPERPGPIFW